MREFDTGATRDTAEGKPEFGGFLSPIALRRFAAYMHKNRVQSDGSLRDSDNWKKGIPRRVYLESLLRHTIDVWEGVTGDMRGHTRRMPEELRTQEALCAIIFNAQGLLREVLLGRDVGDPKGPSYTYEWHGENPATKTIVEIDCHKCGKPLTSTLERWAGRDGHIYCAEHYVGDVRMKCWSND